MDELKDSLDILWTLIASAMVLLMQAGFLCIESGFARAKNSINVAIKNICDLVISVTVFWFIGFVFMFSTSQNGIIGLDLKFLVFDPREFENATAWFAVFFVFQAVFAGTAATIISGAVAGRTKFSAYLLISGIISGVVYPIFGHWAWGSLLLGEGNEGWLQKLGFLDFAGSTVVHSVGGWLALAAIFIIGPRHDKFKDNVPQVLQPHNLTLAYFGVIILLFGWFGFNCGSTTAVTKDVAMIALTTLLSACGGCISCSFISWINSPYKRPEGEMIGNGLLGGLVGITAGCNCVSPGSAFIIGLISGLTVYYTMHFIERKLKLDDVVGAVAVHGVCGAWGTIAVGLFISEVPEGMTRITQIGVQILGVVVCFVWCFGAGYVLLKIIDTLIGLRVPLEDEKVGLNISEHGASSSTEELKRVMKDVIETGNYSNAKKIIPEIGTEIGEITEYFNVMIETLKNHKADQSKRLSTYNDFMSKIEMNMTTMFKNIEEIEKELRNISDDSATLILESEKSNSSASQLMSFFEDLLTLVTDVTNNGENMKLASEESLSSSKTTLEKSDVIKDFTGMIESVIHKIKFLSLNASIHSGNSRDGGNDVFKYIAKEMRDLSEDSMKNIDRINSELDMLLKSIHKSNELAKTGSKNIDGIIRSVENLSNDVGKKRENAEKIVLTVEGTYKVATNFVNNIEQICGKISDLSKIIKLNHDHFKNLN